MTYVALLRGINVGKAKQVSMAKLRQMFLELDFEDPKTLLLSGNVVFRAPKREQAAIEQQLEAAARRTFGFEIAFVVRTVAELDEAILRNPFGREADSDPSHLLVMFLRDEVDAAEVGRLERTYRGPEQICGDRREIYLYYPEGIAHSKLKIPFLGTARNWNTVRKLAALAKAESK